MGSPATNKGKYSLSPQTVKFQKSNSVQMSPMTLPKVEEEVIKSSKSSSSCGIQDPFGEQGTEEYPTIEQNYDALAGPRGRENSITKEA